MHHFFHLQDHDVAAGGIWDDEYGTRNRNSCTIENDGPARHQTDTLLGSRDILKIENVRARENADLKI